jgi:hypothetical protein
LLGTPFSQTSAVQGFPSFGLSLSSATDFSIPLPSQTIFWQSPLFCAAIVKPAASKSAPHTPALHVRCEHDVSFPGQSFATLHPPFMPLELLSLVEPLFIVPLLVALPPPGPSGTKFGGVEQPA